MIVIVNVPRYALLFVGICELYHRFVWHLKRNEGQSRLRFCLSFFVFFIKIDFVSDISLRKGAIFKATATY